MTTDSVKYQTGKTKEAFEKSRFALAFGAKSDIIKVNSSHCAQSDVSGPGDPVPRRRTGPAHSVREGMP